MAKQYQPQTPFTVPFTISSAIPVTKNGITSLSYSDESREVYFCSAKAYVGTTKNVNSLSVEEDTLTVDTYWIPSLKRKDRIRLLDDNSVWEVNVTPENINRRNQYSRFTVVRISG